MIICDRCAKPLAEEKRGQGLILSLVMDSASTELCRIPELCETCIKSLVEFFKNQKYKPEPTPKSSGSGIKLG